MPGDALVRLSSLAEHDGSTDPCFHGCVLIPRTTHLHAHGVMSSNVHDRTNHTGARWRELIDVEYAEPGRSVYDAATTEAVCQANEAFVHQLSAGHSPLPAPGPGPSTTPAI